VAASAFGGLANGEFTFCALAFGPYRTPGGVSPPPPPIGPDKIKQLEDEIQKLSGEIDELGRDIGRAINNGDFGGARDLANERDNAQKQRDEARKTLDGLRQK
jgi:hypothetical protein